MITIEEFRQCALSFPEAVELPHFERASFRVRKKIFATLAVDKRIGTLMLTPEDQSVFCSMSAGSVYPVPGKWGKHGATFVDLKKVKKALLEDAMTMAYCKVGPKKLAETILRQIE